MYGASKLMKTLNIQDALQINLRICKPKQEFSPDSNSYTITLNLFISLRILTLFKNYLRFFLDFTKSFVELWNLMIIIGREYM